MKATKLVIALCSTLAAAGCGGAAAGGQPNGGNGGPDGGGQPSGVGGNAAPVLPADATVGTYIILGDTISLGATTGPALLAADLTAKFPGLMVVNGAKPGAITDVYSDNAPAGAPTLKDEIAALGHAYPGDVVVSITIGGNDLDAHAVNAILGTDQTFRDQLAMHLAAELGELTTPGRLGSGKVYVVLANIYDFTDGMGDFATVKCGPGVNVSGTVTQTAFGNWNGVLKSGADGVGGTIYDMHADFLGHGYNNTNAADVWFGGDPSITDACKLPNATGNDAIRRSLYRVLTGTSLP